MDHKRHVLALYETAQKQKKLDEVLHSIESFNHVFSNEIKGYLDSPLVSIKDKVSLISSFQLDAITEAWLTIIVKQRNIREFESFHRALTQFIRELNKDIHVDVFVAKALTDASQAKIKRALRSFFDAKDITLHMYVDKTLIGGMKIMYQGMSLDQTIITMLDELQTVI